MILEEYRTRIEDSEYSKFGDKESLDGTNKHLNRLSALTRILHDSK